MAVHFEFTIIIILSNAVGDGSPDIEVEEITRGHAQFQGENWSRQMLSRSWEENITDSDSDIELIELNNGRGGEHSFGGRKSERSLEEDESSLLETEVCNYEL